MSDNNRFPYPAVFDSWYKDWHRSDGFPSSPKQCAFAGWNGALKTLEAAGTSYNSAITPCLCRKDIFAGVKVLVIDERCSVHGGTAQ